MRLMQPLRGLALSPSGTQLKFDGTICGQHIKMLLNDRTDRQAFTLEVDCPDGGRVMVTTSDKGTTPVAAVDADIIRELLQRIPMLP